MERLELKSSVKNSSIKIDEIQRHKGKLIVHWSTKADESKMEPSLGGHFLLICIQKYEKNIYKIFL